MFNDFGRGASGAPVRFGKIFRTLSKDRPAALRTDVVARAEGDAATRRRFVLQRLADDGVRERVSVDVPGALQRLARQRDADNLGASLRSLGRGVAIIGTAREALGALRDQLTALSDLASQASGPLSSADRAALDTAFSERRNAASAVIAGATFGGIQLLDGGIAGGAQTRVVATASVARAERAQTRALSRSETIAFKSTGLFAGLSSSQRKVALSAGDTQQDVVDKINGDADIGARVRASIGDDGRLVIEALQKGSAAVFQLDSNRNAADDSSGVGRSHVDSAAGTDDRTQAGTVTAALAQTRDLARRETITFKNFGVFKGLSRNDREIDLQAGDSQSDVVRKINESDSVGRFVVASVDDSGRLVLTAKQAGRAYEFEVDASRGAGSNTTGIGTADIASAGATDGENRAAFVTARRAQTSALRADEEIRFDDKGIFDGLSRSERTVTLSKGATQQDVIAAINGDATVGQRVIASADAAGRLVITAREAGSDVSFELDSDRRDRADSTGVGTSDLEADNGVTVVTEQQDVPALQFGSADLGFELSLDSATLQALGIDEIDLSTAEGAQQAVVALQSAVTDIDAQVRAADLQRGALDRTQSRLGARLEVQRGQATTVQANEQADGARARTLQDATSALLLYSSLRPELALRLLQ